jgi:phosphoglycolate phosphatase-like HAD superfamily hydrolase
MLKAIVFDFDGVILESVDIKTRAFTELFKEYPDHLERIVRLHLDNTGMSRFDKFKIICGDYLGRAADDSELARLGEAFSRLVYQEILHCPFVPGAYEFLEKRYEEYQMFVASATPEDELSDIVEGRELGRFFKGIYGSPRKKDEILARILVERELRPPEVVFIGDSMGDYGFARETSIPFIGRVARGQADVFPREHIVAIIEDLYELDQEWNVVVKQFGAWQRSLL